MSKIISFINHKGGVGKTTLSVNLAAGLAIAGAKVLIIDSDTQRNCTESLGLKVEIPNLSDVFLKDSDIPIIKLKNEIYKGNLDIVPSHHNMAKVELAIVSEINRESILKEALEKVKDLYDFILIDCPPALNLVTLNALAASNGVIIPVDAEFFSYKGIDTLLEFTTLVQKKLNKNLLVEGVVFARYNGTRTITKEIRNEIKAAFGDKMFESTVSISVKFTESQAASQSIFEYDPESKAAFEYQEIIKEFLKKQ